MPSGSVNISTNPYLQSYGVQDAYRYNGELPPEIAIEEQALNRRQQIANLLMQRGLQQPQGQMAGRFYVAPSPFQNLAQLAQVAAGAYGTYRTDQDRAGLAEKNKNLTAKAVEDYLAKMQGTPTQVPVQGPGAPVPAMSDQDLQNKEALGATPAAMASYLGMQQEGPQPSITVTKPPSDMDKRAMLVKAMTSQIPGLRDTAMLQAKMEADVAEKATQRDFLSQEKALDREARLQGQEVQLNQAMLLGLITKEQKDQMLELQRQQLEQTGTIKQLEIDAKREQAQIGKTPPGYRQTKEGNLEAVPGGPADTKLQGQLNTDTASLNTITASLDNLITNAKALRDHPGLPRITGVVGAFPDVPGTEAANARALLESLRSKTAVSAIQDMRTASKTGGAVGQVTEKEWPRLENLYQALSTAQSESSYKKALNDLIDYAEGIKGRAYDSFNMKHKGANPEKAAVGPGALSTGPVKITSDADYNALPSGATFIGPDGKTRKKP